MISILDYRMGNLRSVQKAFEHAGAAARIITTADQVRQADKLVLPGVGAFADAMNHLRDQGVCGFGAMAAGDLPGSAPAV